MLNLPKSEPVRLGFLVPERNVTCEVEFPFHLPVGVTAHFSRLPRKGAEMSADSLLEMMESVDVQSELLTKINVRVIMAACTSGSFLSGTNAADELGVRIKRVTGIPGISTSTAVVDALRAMDVRRFFMITPYPHDITRAEVEFFEEFGFNVTGTDTFDCTHAPMIPALPSPHRRSLIWLMPMRLRLPTLTLFSLAAPTSLPWIKLPKWKNAMASR